MTDKTKIFADANLAKCDAFEKAKTLQQLQYWIIDCQIDETRKVFDDLSRLIWMVNSNCLDEDQLCSVGKRLKSYKFKTIICQPEDISPCGGLFPCSEITIDTDEPEDCTIPITAVK